MKITKNGGKTIIDLGVFTLEVQEDKLVDNINKSAQAFQSKVAQSSELNKKLSNKDERADVVEATKQLFHKYMQDFQDPLNTIMNKLVPKKTEEDVLEILNKMGKK